MALEEEEIHYVHTEVVVLHGPAAGSWHVDGQVLPVSTSFKYPGLIFQESDSLTKALNRLLQNSHGARARLAAKYKALSFDSSFAMMRRLFTAVGKPTVAYGCEIWAGLDSPGKTHGDDSLVPAWPKTMPGVPRHFAL